MRVKCFLSLRHNNISWITEDNGLVHRPAVASASAMIASE
jgi:hypothetical protein